MCHGASVGRVPAHGELSSLLPQQQTLLPESLQDWLPERHLAYFISDEVDGREFGAPEDKAQVNFTDPDSRIMKRASGGYDAGYNTQTAVDDTVAHHRGAGADQQRH